MAKKVTMKKSKPIKNNLVAGEFYIVTLPGKDPMPSAAFVEYARNDDLTKRGLVFADGKEVPIMDGMSVEWDYTRTQDEDWSHDPCRCADCARMYAKYGLSSLDPSALAWEVQQGKRPWRV